MLRFSTWKFLAILAMTLAAVLVVAPSMLSPSNYQALASRLPSWLTPPTIVLGLDLQGGSHVMLEVDQADLVSTQVKNLRDDVRRILREEKVAMTRRHRRARRAACSCASRTRPTAQRSCPSCAMLSQRLSAPMIGGQAPLEVEATPRRPDPGRPSPTPASTTSRARPSSSRSRSSAAASTRSARANPSIQRQGDDRILVQVPGLQDPQHAQGNSRPDREARIPPRRRARPEPDGSRGAAIRSTNRASCRSRSRSWCRARI